MRATLFFTACMFLFALSESSWTSYGVESVSSLEVAEAPAQRVIDEYVNSEMESQRIPGLSLAVVRAGKLVQTKDYGKTIIEFDRFEHDQEEIVKTAFGPMLARPGEKFGYSNVGYRLLRMLIEKVSGQSYWDFLAHRIFRPIGMEATRNSDPKTVILNRAR